MIRGKCVLNPIISGKTYSVQSAVLLDIRGSREREAVLYNLPTRSALVIAHTLLELMGLIPQARFFSETDLHVSSKTNSMQHFPCGQGFSNRSVSSLFPSSSV